MLDGRPTVLIGGRPVEPLMYALTDAPGGRWSWEELPRRNLAIFAAAGFELFQADLWLEHMWTSARTLDIGLARRQIRGITDVCPRACVVLRLHVNAPPWWTRTHPEECVGYSDGPVDAEEPAGLARLLERDLDRCRRASLASRPWRRDAGRNVTELLRELAETPEGDALGGIQVAGGVFGEWSYFGFIDHEPDTGPAMRDAFRRRLAATYPDDDALRSAWGDPRATRSTAEVPGLKERSRTLGGVFRDPQRERRAIDYAACHHDEVVDAILHFCRIVKESWPRPLLVGVFYGYLFSQFGRQATGGHLRPDRILDSPDVDFLCGPPTYQPYSRELGGTGMSRGLVESCALHGKLWFDEMDQPTHFGHPTDRSFSCSRADAAAVLRRNSLAPLLRGAGLWYYDFGPRFSAGWWDDPILIGEIGRIKRLADERGASRHEPVADVLLVCDADVFRFLGTTYAVDPVSEPSLDECAAALLHTGVALDMVYLSDLQRIALDRYRCIVFANTWLLDASDRRWIREEAAAAGRHLVWSYAPGYTDGERLSPDYIGETTGIRVRTIELAAPLRVAVHVPGAGEEALGIGFPVRPLFAVDDCAAEPLGWYEGTGIVAAARRCSTGASDWYFALPPYRPGLLRAICRAAGAHVYTDDGDVLYAGRGMLCLHTHRGGPRTVRLKGGPSIVVDLPPRSTTLLDAASGKTLLG